MLLRPKPIVFVKERGDRKTERESGGETSPLQTLSGSEAKQFYEDVLSLPEESSSKGSRSKRKRKRSTTKRGHRETSKHAKTVSVNTTVSQVFRYVQEGNLEAIQTALSSGVCDTDTTDQYHWTLLMSAASAGHSHIAEYLLSVGAQWTNCVDRSGRNAVDLARTSGHLSLAYFIENFSETTANEQSTTDTRKGELRTLRGKSESYFCEVCQQRVRDSSRQSHSTSTVHQFSCQHSLRPPSSYGIPRSNRGYQMMLMSGWDPERGLGCEQEGRKYPLKTVLKRNRLGFGQKNDEGLAQSKPKVTHFGAFDERAVKRNSERYEKGKNLRKKDILVAVRKDKEWEVRMRRYMNSEEEIPN